MRKNIKKGAKMPFILSGPFFNFIEITFQEFKTLGKLWTKRQFVMHLFHLTIIRFVL
jgi:hypothetical protein